ncbi:hypothetical protein FEK29_09820 [Maribacter aurantiacus]|uniref:Uncharacterized protein n=1 Tax=Maribacter aurantiacus TaxID=1882343 RepID=A0A5R8M6D2_9FLAO|nr:hypothetical protein FEK29_09820 [Maribacter aurantiacus]
MKKYFGLGVGNLNVFILRHTHLAQWNIRLEHSLFIRPISGEKLKKCLQNACFRVIFGQILLKYGENQDVLANFSSNPFENTTFAAY